MPRLAFALVLATAALTLTATAGAQVYKWKDAHGTTHFSDAPPPAGSKYEQVKLNGTTVTPPAATPPAAAGSAATATSTQTAASTPAPAKVPDTAANRAKLCTQLTSNIALLQGSSPLTSGDAGGKQQNMTDLQRRQELATAQAQQKQYCQG